MRTFWFLACVLALLIPTPALSLPDHGFKRQLDGACQKGRNGSSKKGGGESDESSNESAAGPTLQRSNRMEFDGRLVKGERASGAVYLFSKARRPLPPLLKFQRDRLEDIVWPVLRRTPAEEAAAVAEAAAAAKAAREARLKEEAAKAAEAKKKASKKRRKARRKKRSRKGSKR